MSVKIYVAHTPNKRSEIVSNAVYVPMCAGAYFDDGVNQPLTGDNMGENISSRNRTFNELTLMYWIWKNSAADYIGLCHYRRFFNFRDESLTEDLWGNHCCAYLTPASRQAYGLDDTVQITNKIVGRDLLHAAWDVSSAGFHNLYEQYGSAPQLHMVDLHEAVEILKELYPEYADAADEYLNSHIMYPCLMFVMKRKLFEGMCDWLFRILFEVEKRLDISNYNREEQRVIGHIGERLFGIYITQLKKAHPYLDVAILQRILFKHSDKIDSIAGVTRENSIPIVMTANDKFLPFVAITLRSLIKNGNLDYVYQVTILHTDVAKRTQALLYEDLRAYSNLEIKFLDVSSYIEGLALDGNMHISAETSYRLLIPDLFCGFEKVLFIDADLIIQADISVLYRTELGECFLAAAHDPDFCGEYKTNTKGVTKYADEKLMLSNPYDYFNAGVMLLNIKAMCREFSPGELIAACADGQYLYMDQDVLNQKCAGHIKYIDMSWNVLTDCGGTRVSDLITQAPARIYDMYQEARKHPKIIHYAGFDKPWQNPSCDMAERFWVNARESIFYECCLQSIGSGRRGETKITEPDPWQRFAFPWDDVSEKSKIIIRGGGEVGQAFIRQLQENGYAEVLAVCDRAKKPKADFGVPYIQPEELPAYAYDKIVIAIENPSVGEDIRTELREMGIDGSKIIYQNPAKSLRARRDYRK